MKDCPKCGGKGLIPFVKNGKVIPHAYVYCECHEDEPERYHPVKPEDYDFPMSKTMSLSIQSSFKLLNTFSFGSEHEGMFLTGQGYKVAQTIIILDAVEVVNYPTIREGLTISLFPNKDMLSNITSFTRSWMFRGIDLNIAICDYFASLPENMLCPRLKDGAINPSCQPVFTSTLSASSSLTANQLPTINTWMSFRLPPPVMASLSPIFSLLWWQSIGTFYKSALNISFYLHIPIVLYSAQLVNRLIYGRY
jgi:hypothetical protein